MIEACVKNSVVRVKLRRLLEVSYFKVASENNIARVIALVSG